MTMRRRRTHVALSALAVSAVLWGSAWPRGGRVHAQDAAAPSSAAPDVLPLLAMGADEIAAVPLASGRADASDPRSWQALLGDGRIHRTAEAFGRGELLLRGDRGRIEALVVLPAGDDAALVELAVPGATAFETGGAGHAIVRAAGGDVAFVRPGLHQERADGRVAVPGAWQDRGQGRVGLQAGKLDADAPLSIGFEVLLLSDAGLGLDRNGDGRVSLEELAPVADGHEGGPSLTATKRDTLVVDVDGDTQADPGDTLRYDVVIGNTGSVATGIQLADPLDPNLTLVPGSVNVSPLAGDDTYEAIGNVTLTVGNPLLGLFANDAEFLGDTFTLTSPAPGAPTPTAGGGTVTVQANGTFTYTTAAGTVATSDSFTYTITDSGGLTGTGTVTFTIAGLVWFVDRDAAPGGTGTQASPFDELADVNGAGGAGDPDAPNHFIYLFDRAAAIDYTGGLELESGQRLVGSGAALVVGTTTVLPAGTPPTVVNGAGDALVLATGVRIEGLNVNAANDAALSGTGPLTGVVITDVDVATSGTGGGLELINQSGQVDFTLGAITGNGTGPALIATGGTGVVNLTGSSINRTAGRLVDVQNKTGGSVTLGTVTGTGAATDAIVLANNTGTGLSFPNGFNVTTTSGRGLLANNTGSFSVGGTTSTVNATGQASLEILDTAISGTATFASLSSTSSLGPGLRLESGVSGALVVTGGVTVTNPNDVGIGIQFTTLSVTIGGPTQISGVGDDVSLVVSGSIGNMSFGATTITGGNDAIRLLNNVGGTRTFASLNASGNTGVGLLHNNGGAVTVTGNTTFTPGGTGIDIQNSVAAVNFGGVTTIDKSGSPGLGLNLVNNTSGPSFATLSVTTSNGAGLAIANSPFGSLGGTLNATGGPAVNATGGAFAASFGVVSSTNSPVQGLNLVSCSGSFTAAAGTITNALGTAFNVNGGDVTASYGGSVTQNAAGQRVVDVQGTTGGAVTVTTATGGASSTGVNIGSANGNVTFGTLNLGTAGSRMTSQAVTVTNGTGTYNLGTAQIFTNGVRGINAQGADGTLNVGGGAVDTVGAPAAIEIDGPAGLTTLGMTLTRVEAANGPRGIRIVDTNGTFTVTGTGTTDASGGTIQDTGASMIRGIELVNATGISLSNVRLTNACRVQGALSDGTFGGNENTDENGAIHLQNVSGVQLTNVDVNGSVQHGINGNVVTNLDIANSLIENTGNAVWESGIYIFNLRGTQAAGTGSSISNTTIRDTGQFNLFVQNNGATNAPGPASNYASVNRNNMDVLTLSNDAFLNSGLSVIGDHVTVFNTGTANFRTVVSNSSFQATLIAGGTRTSDSIQVDASGSARSDFDITGSTFSEANVAINVSASGTGFATFDVHGNPSISNRASTAVNVAVNGDSEIRGFVRDNPSIFPSVANNSGFGIDMVVDQTGRGVVSITNNVVRTNPSNATFGFDTGVRGGARNAGTGEADITLTGNTVASGGTDNLAGLWLFAGNGSAGETNLVRVNLQNNTIDMDPVTGFVDYFLEQYTGNVFQIQGLTPPAGATAAQVAAFVAATDADPSPTDPTVDVASGTVVNYTAGSPALP